MKKWIVIAIVLLIGFLIYLKITGFYNKAIIQKEDAK
ncbi:MAG: LemA family protein, partial [Flavobacteriales bacterium CG_4_10_14_0_2_um_filter_35_18]